MHHALTLKMALTVVQTDAAVTMLAPGTLVMPHVNAQHHQHMFCARIDPAIDDELGGKDVLVTEVGAVLNSFIQIFNLCGQSKFLL